MTDRDHRLTFVILWLFTLMNYIYGDIGMLFQLTVDPALLARLQRGLTSGGNTDLYFLGGAIFMEISFLMLPVSWLAPQRAARLGNIGAGILFTLAMAAILLGPLARGRMPAVNYYSFCARVEIVAPHARSLRERGGFMGTYTVYRLDGTGRIHGAEWLTAVDDRFALEGARSIAGSRGWFGGCEVWQLDRKVGRVVPQPSLAG